MRGTSYYEMALDAGMQGEEAEQYAQMLYDRHRHEINDEHRRREDAEHEAMFGGEPESEVK